LDSKGSGKYVFYTDGGLEWKATMFSSAHLCDILLALTLLPTSKRSFIPTIFKVSPGEAIRVHQLTGNLLILAVLFHIGSYAMFEYHNLKFEFLRDIFLIGKSIAFDSFNIPFGITTFICLLSIRITSWPYFRRNRYEFFLVAHYVLIVSLLLFSFLHAASNFYWTFPSLVLYSLDLFYRFYSYYTERLTAFATIELSGLICLEITGSRKTCFAGQYFLVTLPDLSLLSHPLSVVASNESLDFLIQPSLKELSWTRQMYNNVLKETEEGSACIFRASIDGPFGIPPFDFSDSLACLVCVIGGSGIAAAIPLLKKASKQGLRCHLFWSVKDHSYIHLSYYQSLIKELKDGLISSVFVTRDVGRMNIDAILSETISKYKGRYVGIYTCGPISLMEDVEKSCRQFSNAVLYREIFEL
jgi:predicted ferric reductase